MSLVPIGISIARSLALGLLGPSFLRFRRIAQFIPNATIEEIHHDELVITDHPVEQGAVISDHAYKAPVGVVIRAGWSNSSLEALGNPNYVQDIYNQLLTLQRLAVPFDIVTGKRRYRNMVMHRLTVVTNEAAEYALIATIDCREVIIVNVQTSSVPDMSVQRTPEATASVTDTGTNQLTPATTYNPVSND